jgi:beta-phosphoglucomutase
MTTGFIFALDGVITDTAEYHFLGWKRLADEEDIPFTREDNEALRGVPRRQSLEILLKGRTYPEAQMQEMMERKNRYYNEFIEQITPNDLLPGVMGFLQAAQARGIKLALGSASKNAQKVCESLQITHMLEVIGDGYSVVNAKPHPDLFVWVAGGLGLSPTQCVVFEDAEAGVEAALAGGFKVVGIGPEERVGKAHQVADGLNNLSVDETLSLLS